MGFLVGIQLARGLGVANYGVYGSAMAAASLGATIAAGGVQLHATREIAKYRARGNFFAASRLLKWSARIVFTISLVTAPFVGAYVIWGQGATFAVASVAMVLTMLTALFALTAAAVRGAGAIVLGQAMNVAIRPVMQASLLLLSALGLGFISPVIALTIASISVLVAMLTGFRVLTTLWLAGAQEPSPLLEESGVWWRASRVMGLTTAVRAAEGFLPLIMLGVLTNTEQAGFFRVASSVVVFVSMAESMITVMVPALTARLYEEGDVARLRLFCAASCIVMSVPTIGIAIILWVFGGPLLAFAFGVDFAPAWAALAVLTIGAGISALGGISISLLHVGNKERDVTRAFAFSLSVSALGSFLLAPQYGAFGVAVAVLCGVVIRTAYLAYASRKYIGIDPTLIGAIKTIFYSLMLRK